MFSSAAVLPDALKTACGSCTQIQKEKALDVVTRLYYEHPDMYLALAERYDPSGVYTKRFEDWFDEQNVLKPRQPINREGNQFVTRNSQAGERRTQGPANSVQRTPNEIKTERTRIPSTWITSTTTTTTTTPRPRASRPTLRTLPPAARTSTRRVLPPEALAQTTTTFRPQTVSFIAPTTVRQVPIQRDPVIFREPPTIRTSTAPPTAPPPIRTFPPLVVSQPSPVFVAPPIPQSFNAQDTRVQNPTTFRENPPSTRATTFAPPTTRIFPPTQQNSFNQQLPQFIPPLPTIREPPAVVRPAQEIFIQPPRLPDFQQLPAFVPTTEPPTQRTFPPTFRPTQSFVPQTQPTTQRTFAPVQRNSFNQQTPQFVQSMPASDFRPQEQTFVQPQPQQPVFVPTAPPPTQRTFPPTFPPTQPPTTQRTIPPTFRTTQAPIPPVQPQTVNRPQPEVREPDAFRPQQNPERNQPVSS